MSRYDVIKNNKKVGRNAHTILLTPPPQLPIAISIIYVILALGVQLVLPDPVSQLGLGGEKNKKKIRGRGGKIA